MTYEELNAFIKNYIENDKTGRAIMLKSDWETGKSYYIKNTLKPFLESMDGGNHGCVIISLYGLTDIVDISKSIYVDLRTVGKTNHTEVKSTGKAVFKIIGKTIFNGLINKIGFDIGSVQDINFQEIYESINLDGKLIIFDDFERSEINKVELLGYINSLCEQDGVKVMIVANESELIKIKEESNKEPQNKCYTSETYFYLRAKEKTIGDTINFFCNYNTAIKSIIELFDDPDLNQFSKHSIVDEIADVYYNGYLYNNLRAFLQACQKSSDIFRYIRENRISISNEIKSIIFYGLMGFTNRITKGKIPDFPRNQYISGDLGFSHEYPLFKFCYDYVVYQKLNESEICKANKIYSKYFLNGKWSSGKDKDLLIIRTCFQRTENEILKAIENIKIKLNDDNIPYYDYGVLINYLIYIYYEMKIEFELQEIKEKCIINIKGKGDAVLFEELFSSELSLGNEKAISEFDSFKKWIKETLNLNNKLESFSYDIHDVDKLCNDMKKVTLEELKIYGYAQKIDAEKFGSLIKRCPSMDIDKIRLEFLHLYNKVDRNAINSEDIIALKNIHKQVKLLKSYENFDKVQKHQISMFADFLNQLLIHTYGKDDKNC